jgi:hypothetical protein
MGQRRASMFSCLMGRMITLRSQARIDHRVAESPRKTGHPIFFVAPVSPGRKFQELILGSQSSIAACASLGLWEMHL